MRVISQDRCYSYDFDRTMFWKQDGVIYAHIVGDTRDRVVGSYKTEERATEVFDDIHKAYAPVYSISNGLNEEQVASMIVPSKNIMATNILNTGPDMCLTTFDNYVYYMPEE